MWLCAGTPIQALPHPGLPEARSSLDPAVEKSRHPKSLLNDPHAQNSQLLPQSRELEPTETKPEAAKLLHPKHPHNLNLGPQRANQNPNPTTRLGQFSCFESFWCCGIISSSYVNPSYWRIYEQLLATSKRFAVKGFSMFVLPYRVREEEQSEEYLSMRGPQTFNDT